MSEKSATKTKKQKGGQPPPSSDSPPPSKKKGAKKKKDAGDRKDAEDRLPTGTAPPVPVAASEMIIARETQAFRKEHWKGAAKMMLFLDTVEELVGSLEQNEMDVKTYTKHSKVSAGLQIALGATALSLGIVLCFVTAGAAVPILIGAGVAASWSSAGASAYGDVARGKRRNKEGVKNTKRMEAKVAEAQAHIDLDTGYGMLKGAVKIVKIGQIGASEYAMNSDSGEKALLASGIKGGAATAGKTAVVTLVEAGGTGAATLAQMGFGISAAGGAISLALGSKNLYEDVKYDSRVVYLASRGALRQNHRLLKMYMDQLHDPKYSEFLEDFSKHFAPDSIADRLRALAEKLLKLEDRIRGTSIPKLTLSMYKAEAKAFPAMAADLDVLSKAEIYATRQNDKFITAKLAHLELCGKENALKINACKAMQAPNSNDGDIDTLLNKSKEFAPKVTAALKEEKRYKTKLKEAEDVLEKAKKVVEQRWKEVEETKD
jgi:hypothetical protein